MQNSIRYKNELRSQLGVCFGQGFIANFVNNKLQKGKEFSPNDFNFVNQLGNSWQKGHLLGVRFGGQPTAVNFIPMTQKSNLCFKSMVEDKLALLLKNKPIIDAMLSCKIDKVEQFRIVYKIIVSPKLIEVEE